MSKGVKIFLKLVIGVSAIGIIALAFYATMILSSNRETVKDMGYNLNNLPHWYMGEKPQELEATVYEDNQSTTIKFDLAIEDIQLESLNTKTDKIISGQDYYLYFTVVFTPKSKDFELKESGSLGRVTSEDWAYTLFIPKDKSESDYQRVISQGETVKLRYYIKTNEPVKDLGFYVNDSIDNETYRHYFKFIKNPKSE